MFNFEFLFMVCNAMILPFWVMLIFIPNHAITKWFSRTYFLQLTLALIYAFLIIQSIGKGNGGFGSLKELHLLFESDGALLAGWIHYLVFDSFVGMWMVRDAQKRNIPHLRIIAPLVFTLLMGPIGLLLYIAYRHVKTGVSE